MTDYLSIIRQPIERELGQFVNLFNSSLTHDGKLQEEISHASATAPASA